MKKMIFVIGVMSMILLTGCSSDKDVKTAKSNDTINEIVVKEITVDEIETEEILIEENIETENIETENIDNEYLKELEYNSQQNKGWN